MVWGLTAPVEPHDRPDDHNERSEMKVSINIPDEHAEILGKTYQEVQQQLYRRLQLMPAPIGPNAKLLVLTNDDRVALERVVSRPLDTAADLLFVVSALASLKIGQVERHLTTGEAHRLKAYADSMGISIDQATKDLIDPIVEEFLMRM